MSGESLDLGHGVTARFLAWKPDRALNPQYDTIPDADPCGLIEDHRAPNGAECSGSLMFDVPGVREVFPDCPLWQVESLDPLTLSPSLLCPTCGHHGFIREGRWVPA